jgi:hypothetical protein
MAFTDLSVRFLHLFKSTKFRPLPFDLFTMEISRSSVSFLCKQSGMSISLQSSGSPSAASFHSRETQQTARRVSRSGLRPRVARRDRIKGNEKAGNPVPLVARRDRIKGNEKAGNPVPLVAGGSLLTLPCLTFLVAAMIVTSRRLRQKRRRPLVLHRIMGTRSSQRLRAPLARLAPYPFRGLSPP